MRLIRYSPSYHRGPPRFSGGFTPAPGSALETEMARLFTASLAESAIGATPAARLPVNLYEDNANTYVRAELPGVNRADIAIEVVNGMLTIAATRQNPAANGVAEPALALNRSLQIDDDVATDQITAAFENGMLTVTLPKREVAVPKKITVTVQ
ncbi:MAG: hypothetical protein RL077_2889 [Verrucomicrobiota bacterium]|jgi:HSP20 family protein